MINCLDCERVVERSIPHAGQHPKILMGVLRDPTWKRNVQAFMEAFVRASMYNSKDLTVLGSCSDGHHRSVATLAMLRWLAIMLGVEPKPARVSHMSRCQWRPSQCGENQLCDLCSEVNNDKMPARIANLIWRDAHNLAKVI